MIFGMLHFKPKTFASNILKILLTLTECEAELESMRQYLIVRHAIDESTSQHRGEVGSPQVRVEGTHAVSAPRMRRGEGGGGGAVGHIGL